MLQDVKELILGLYRIGSIQFGEFELKSGIKSPFYLDLRLLISHPRLLRHTSHLLWDKIKDLNFDCVCGVPYTALPIATAISLEHNVPMVMRRKEGKGYGLKKMIEGHFTKGNRCLIVEDLITSGASIFETIDPLLEAELEVQDVIVLIDRQQGGKEKLEEQGYKLHSLFTISEMLDFLRTEGKITSSIYDAVIQYLNHAKV